MKLLLSALLCFLLVGGLALTGTARVVAQAPGEIVIINSDTTWTKADNPYSLTGPLLVSNGATLTIEAGVTVNLSIYDIRVEGTLRAMGSSDEKIHFNKGNATGKIDFRPNSTPWNEQTGSGCVIEHTIIENTTIASNVTLKIANCDIVGELAVGASSIIVSNTVTGRHFSSTSSLPYAVSAGDSSLISGNTITGASAEGQAWALYYSLCYAVFAGDSSVISNNDITGKVKGGSSQVLNNRITGDVEASSGTISSNTIIGIVKAHSSTVTNNVISGGQPTFDWATRPNDPLLLS